MDQFNQPPRQKNKEELAHLQTTVRAINEYLDLLLESTFDLKARKKYMISNAQDFLSKKEEINDRIENLGVVDTESDEKIEAASKNYLESDKIIHEDTVPETEFDLESAIAHLKELDTTGEVEENLRALYRGAGARNWKEFIYHLNTVLKDEPDYWDSYKRKSESFFVIHN